MHTFSSAYDLSRENRAQTLILAAARAFSSAESHLVFTGQSGRMKTTMIDMKIVRAPSTKRVEISVDAKGEH